MEKTKIMNKSRELVIFLAFVVTLVSIGATIGDQSSRKGSLNKTASTFGLFNINNLTIPFDNKGVIADVNVPGVGSYGKFGGHTFLFSSGFFISGLHNGDLFGNGVLTASRISDYVAGPAGSLASDAKNRVYVVSVQDPAFGKSWQDWKTAVSIGADFYDGDGDGVYNPVDKNANGTWDSDEDRPDLIGDWTGWTVFNDGLPKAQRTYTNVDPKGIEIHQSIFGFSSRGIVGNMMFLRYRIINTGRVADRFDSVFFSVAADPDLGDYGDDLVGCDTLLSAGFVYNDGDDPVYGPNAPAFLIDFFQGPIAFVPGVSFIDNNSNGLYDSGEAALDTAWDVKGKFLGKHAIIGAKNLPLTSFTQYMQTHPTHGDPNNIFILRNYIKGGRGQNGDLLNVCTWGFGNGASLPNCANIDPKFMYSGDPETRTGWLNNTPIDQRQMSNTGPFALEKGKPIDIIAVYIAGRGTNPLNSVTVAKDYSRTAQLVFDNNFPSPPPPPPVNVALTTGANFIDLDWPTADLIKYRARDTVLDVDRRFQGFFVTQYLTNAKTSSIQGVEAAKIVAHYQIHNHVRGVFQRKGNGGIDLVIEDLASEFKLDSLLYSNPSTGRIKVRLNRDAFTATPFIKGRDYYFTVTAYTLNHSVIQNRATNTYGPVGEYIDMTGAGIDYYESPIYPITFGENLFTPALAPTPSTQTSGKSKGNVKLLVVDKAALTGDEYVVEFFPDTTAIPYAPFWRLRNVTRGTTLIDSSKVYDFDTTNYSGKIFQGFIPKIERQTPVYPTNNNVQIQYISANPSLTNTNVSSFAVSGTNLFAGTYGGGVFLSTNNGTSWRAASTGLTNLDVRSLAVSGTNLFAGSWGGGVFLSTNNGTSWTAASTGLTNLDVRSLAVSGTNLFAGTWGGGFFLSTNNGTSWTAASTGLTNTNVECLAVSGTNLFAGTEGGGVFLSTNSGTSWTAASTGLTNTRVQSLAVSGTNLFAGTEGGGVFLSTNSGTSWTAANTGLKDTFVLSLAVSGTNLFAGTLGGVFLSTNNGTSWTAASTGLRSTNVRSLAVSGTNLFAGTWAGGVFLSTNNGTSWTTESTRWFSDFSDPGGLGVFYAGRDLEQQLAGGLPTAVNLNLKSNVITADRLRTIEIRFGTSGKAYRFLRGFKGSGISRRATVVYAGVVTAADTTRNVFGGGTVGKLGEGFVDVPFTAWVKDTVFGEERQLEVAFIEHSVAARGRPDGIWDTDTALLNTQEYIIVFDSPYSATPTNKIITGSGSTNWSDIRGYINDDATLTPFQVRTARSPWFNALYIVGLQQRTSTSYPTAGDILRIPMRVYPYTDLDKFTFRTLAQGQISEAQEREIFENVNVFPNPLFAFNPATSFDATANPDDPFVTFTNLPTEVTVKIYTLGGQLIRTLNESDKIGGVNSPFLRWDIENEAGLRAASGMYLAIVSSPKYGEKILKLAIIMPQKQLPRF